MAWLTPVEIFAPHFGASIAHYLTTHHLYNFNTLCSTNNNTLKISSKFSGINDSTKNKERIPRTHQPLVIYEIGGGTGTLARDILNWLQQYYPNLHATCQYTCIEISPTLAELQYKRVVTEQGGVHKHQFQVVRGDAAEMKTWEKENFNFNVNPREENGDGPCFVLAMEVLDNLPHDKVVYSTEKETRSAGSYTTTNSIRDEGIRRGRWLEALVAESLDSNDKSYSQYKEIYKPVHDPLIHRCLQTWLDKEATSGTQNDFFSFSKNIFQKLIDVAVQGGGGTAAGTLPSSTSRHHHHYGEGGGSSSISNEIFLPTGALRVFDTLHKVRPHHRLLAADFDFLPETVIQGENAPLVATTTAGVTKDHSSYLVQPGVADIFFPSDFELLARLYNQSRHNFESSSAGAGAKYIKSKDFFEKWGTEVDGKEERRKTRCRDGYDPLLEDYSNTSFLFS